MCINTMSFSMGLERKFLKNSELSKKIVTENINVILSPSLDIEDFPEIRTNCRKIGLVELSDGTYAICWDCYFYGFVDGQPDNFHLCRNCRLEGNVPCVEVSFEEWRLCTNKEEFKRCSFQGFMKKLHE